MDIPEAKTLFFKYDGSRFYMSRDGVEATYQLFNVPREVEAAWLQELTRVKLQLLSRNANFAVLQFLNHHADYRHLAEVVASEPRGALWQRCAFLENLLAYACNAQAAGSDPGLVAQAVQKVIVESERLLQRARSEDSIRRVRAVLMDARQRVMPG